MTKNVPAIAPKSAYDSAMSNAKLAGQNWGRGNEYARKMCVDLIHAAVVPDEDGNTYSLRSAIVAAKKEMGFDKLDRADYRKATTMFGYTNTIFTAWPDLSEDTQTGFLAGKVTPSTLATQIKDADKQELAKDEAEGQAEEQVQERVEQVSERKDAETVAKSEKLDVVQALALAKSFTKSLAEQGMQMASAQELVALHELCEELDAFRAGMAQRPQLEAA